MQASVQDAAWLWLIQSVPATVSPPSALDPLPPSSPLQCPIAFQVLTDLSDECQPGLSRRRCRGARYKGS